MLVKMDRLVLDFSKTEPGARFAAWKATRMACDLGKAAPTEPATSKP